MVHAVFKPDDAKGLLRRHRIPRYFRHDGHILARSETRNQVVELKDKSDMVSSVLCELSIVGVGQVRTSIEYLPFAGRVEPSDDIEECRLPASGRAQ